jgi:hypothetical protein
MKLSASFLPQRHREHRVKTFRYEIPHSRSFGGRGLNEFFLLILSLCLCVSVVENL